MNKDPIVLSYEDSVLRKSDVDLLYGPHWLNDNVISFYFEYLKNSFHGASHILFVSPEVTQCIKITPVQQIGIFLDPLEAKKKKFIFFALNDNERPLSAGGTHWSLLLFLKTSNSMHHYDSSRGSNGNQAYSFSEKFFTYLNVEGRFLEEVSMQQNNGYDCGIYLICNAEYLTKYLVLHKTLQSYSHSNDFYSTVANMREHVLNVIEKLKS